MKRKKLIIGLAIVSLLVAVLIVLNFSHKRAAGMAVELSFVGYTNVNGTSMGLFKIQNKQSRRIWLRHVYVLGEAFQEPAGAWQCPDQAASNRWNSAPLESRLPDQDLPPEPTPTSPDPTNLMVPVPRNQPLWRIGATVEFNIKLAERISVAWKTRNAKMLDSRQFINNSPEAIWVESPVITNATVLSDGTTGGIRTQP